MGCFVRCLLLGPLWAAAVLFGAEDDSKERAKVFWNTREAGQRAAQERQYSDLIRSMSSFLKLDDERVRKLLDAAKPVVDAGLEHWRKIYELHVAANGEDDTDPDFFTKLSDSVHHPTIQASRENLHRIWAEWLKANLSAEELIQWEEEGAKRRVRAITAMPKGVQTRVDQATKGVMDELKGEIAQKVSDAELDETRAAKLEAALTKVEPIYRRSYQQKIESVLEDWKRGDFLTELRKVEALEKQGAMTLYVPGAHQVYLEACKSVEEAWKAMLTAEEKKKISDKELIFAKRLDAATKQMNERVKEHSVQPLLMKQQTNLDLLNVTLALDEERKRKLQTKLGISHKEALSDWEKDAMVYLKRSIQKMVRKGNRDDRMKQIEGGSYWFSPEKPTAVLAARLRKDWDQMLVEGLTTEQRKAWGELREKQKTQREQMWLAMLVSEIDSKARLSVEQRQKMEQVLLPLSKDLALVNDLKGILRYQSLSMLVVMLEGVEGQKWTNILEPWQSKAVRDSMSKYQGYWSTMKSLIEAAKEKQLP